MCEVMDFLRNVLHYNHVGHKAQRNSNFFLFPASAAEVIELVPSVCLSVRLSVFQHSHG